MAYFEKLYEFEEGQQYICYLCKATLRAQNQFIRHVSRHIKDKSRWSCSNCHVVRCDRRVCDFKNKRHQCWKNNLNYSLKEHPVNSKDCRNILSKAYLIPVSDFDRELKDWKESGKPDSFGNQTDFDTGIINVQSARRHRNDVKHIEELVTLNFNPTGLTVGNGLPNPWSSYGHYLYLDQYPESFREALKEPKCELKGVKRKLDEEFAKRNNITCETDKSVSTNAYSDQEPDVDVVATGSVSDLNLNVAVFDNISLPDSGIVEISPAKFVGPSDDLLTITDMMQHELEIAHVLSTWGQEQITEASTNVNTTVESNLEELSISQTFDMPANLDNIVGWIVPEIGSQEVVVTQNNIEENISVLFDVTDTEEVSTQTVLCVDAVSTQTLFCKEEVSTQTLLCKRDVATQAEILFIAGVDDEYKLRVVKPTDACGTQTGFQCNQYLEVDILADFSQTNLVVKDTEVAGTQTYLASHHMGYICDHDIENLNIRAFQEFNPKTTNCA